MSKYNTLDRTVLAFVYRGDDLVAALYDPDLIKTFIDEIDGVVVPTPEGERRLNWFSQPGDSE